MVVDDSVFAGVVGGVELSVTGGVVEVGVVGAELGAAVWVKGVDTVCSVL